MASNNIYGTCLRSLRSRQPRIHPATFSLRTSAPSRPASIRHFAASLRRSAGLAQESKPQNEEKLEPRPDPQDSAVLRIAKQLRKHAAAQTETYVAYGGTKALFSECGKHATYTIPQASEKDVEIPKTAEGEDIGVGGGWWHDELGLPPTFSTWAQVTFLHMYLLTTRLRHFPEDVAPKWHQHLTDHFFARAEELMITHHSIHSGSIRSRYLKDLFSQWRGVIASYDEGILKGDATLAAAIWRNAFKGRDDVDAKSLAQIVGWMRRELVRLQETDDADVASANWTFESPKEEARAVMIESRLMKEGVEGESSA